MTAIDCLTQQCIIQIIYTYLLFNIKYYNCWMKYLNKLNTDYRFGIQLTFSLVY